jgi:hypothetical protein
MTHRNLSGGFIVGLTVAAASGVADAATVTTPALGAFGTNRLVCTVTNAGTKDVDARIQIVTSTGTQLTNLLFTIPPGQSRGAGTVPAPTQGFCRVPDVPKAKVRVALCVTDSVLNCIAAVPGE